MGRKKLPTPVKYCERCGKQLMRRPLASGYEEPLFFFNQRKYCSVSCANKTIAEKRVKEPARSEKTSRQRARSVVLNAPCAICGKTGYTEVHHIDKNPMNNNLENLVRLCKSCHAKQHRQRASCVVCSQPVKGNHLCSKHWQAWRKSNQRGWDTEYTATIRRKLEEYESTSKQEVLHTKD